MKNFSTFKSIPMMIGLALIFSIFIIKPVKAQNELKKEKNKTVVLKVVSDKDGKTTIIDTTFTTDDIDPDALKKMAKELQIEMKGLEKEMKDVQVMITADIPDSGEMDSITKKIEKCIVIQRGPGGHVRVHGDKNPHRYEYKYNFDFPCEVGDLPSPEDFEDIYRGHGNVFSGGDFFYREKRGETISDVIGDIPMSKVKNYSIKNTKYGKKIVIEIED
ncbi:MAG: hypothetical protein WCO93_03985 [bacterium]